MIETAQLEWRGNELFRQGSRHPVLSIEPDATYPAMWRVRRPDGTLTDMVNRTRAKDAGLSIARRHLEAREKAVGAPYSDFNAKAVA
jgi:hypothetical protein